MVQHFLKSARAFLSAVALTGLLVTSLAIPTYAGQSRKNKPSEQQIPELLLEGGRKLSFERTYTNERDIRGKPGFWGRLVDVVAGERDYKAMLRPYGVAVDSKGRVIVSDPGMSGIHIFDPAQRKYKFIERLEKSKDAMMEPQCITVDGKDNIYVTDSKAGKVFMFQPSGKYIGVLGSIKGSNGEGFFKRPTGIAIDPDKGDVYVTDTLRDKIYLLDKKGGVIRTIGQHGSGPGEFNYPTEILARSGLLVVVDAMNFRVQLFDREGKALGQIGSRDESAGGLFRPKGIAIDSEGHIYLVEGLSGTVQVFDREGRLLYSFGQRGTEPWQFQLPAGLFIDKSDRVYVVDSYNRRVQVFQYRALHAAGGQP
ncbi:MAG TPA: 6-bladed beta-propeller [Terriglobales bacterium]|nr:6-bladed beta-propeller [Terriglobales bacterium]